MSLTCYHCGEEVSPEGNVCILCGADKDISTELSGAKAVRNLASVIAFIVMLLLQNFPAMIGLSIGVFYAVNKYYDNYFKKTYPDKKIKMF